MHRARLRGCWLWRRRRRRDFLSDRPHGRWRRRRRIWRHVLGLVGLRAHERRWRAGWSSTGWIPMVIFDYTYTTIHLYFGLWYRFLCVFNILLQNILKKALCPLKICIAECLKGSIVTRAHAPRQVVGIVFPGVAVALGLGHIVALYHRSSTIH
jgi:hypothetical protein